ncbi:MAG: sulfatase-like hydrolase/transferase [Rubellimicrobium sp.]|nr:sulfatase-like hydrolase/transferase [Rubellimicrobium sp.]
MIRTLALPRPLVVARLLLWGAVIVTGRVLALPQPGGEAGPAILLVLCLGGAWALGRGELSMARGTPFLALVLAALLIAPPAVLYRGFGAIDVGALFFHTWAGIADVGPGILATEIRITVFALAGLVVALSLLAGTGRRPGLLLMAGAAVLLMVNPAWRIGLGYGLGLGGVPDLRLETRLVWPDPAALPADAPAPDIVHVFLEGLDRRFLDPAVGGGAYAPMSALAAMGTAFTDIRSVAGTSWSIAGMVAAQCGVPLSVHNINHNRTTERLNGAFLPGAICLGDLLAARGYRSAFVVGADTSFGGIGNFLHSHGTGAVLGTADLGPILPPDLVAAAAIDWGLDDSATYQGALAVLAPMLDDPAPLALTVETVGPHGTTSYLAHDCTEDGRATTTPDTAASVRCLAEATARFVEEVRRLHRQADRGRELRIVVQSDHLNHAAEFLGGDERLSRNTLILIGGIEAGAENRTPGSMMDVYPTLIDWLGLADGTDGADGAPVRAGLGRSLVQAGSMPSLVETHDPDDLDDALLMSTGLFTRLWLPGPDLP